MSPPANTARNMAMVRDRMVNRMTYVAIGAKYGVSKQQARRIVLANVHAFAAARAVPAYVPPADLAATIKRKKDGRLSQDQLLRILVPAIDAARGKVSSAARDQARRLVADLIRDEAWSSKFIVHNLGRVRLRWLASNGVGEAMEFLTKEKV